MTKTNYAVMAIALAIGAALIQRAFAGSGFDDRGEVIFSNTPHPSE